MNRVRADLALAAITIIWGTTFVVVKSALVDISTFLFLTLRFCVAALAMSLIFRRVIVSKKLLKMEFLGPGLLAGGLLFAAYVFQTLGLEFTTPSHSAFLTGLSIPMVPLASSLVYRDRPRLREIAGILIASGGMVLMTLPSGSSGFGMGKGDFLSVLCAVTFALHIVVTGRYSRIIGFEPLAVGQLGMAAALSLLAVGFAEPVRFHATVAVASAVLITGLMATALAFTTLAWAQLYTTASRAALIFTLEPVVAWATSWLLTGETMAGRGKAGAGLILAGILLVELKRTKPEEHRKRGAVSLV
jgi:drug/metabolite transporter (DMT)-like permease